ncbi:MAG TPA: hypothetical protein VMS64_36820 [Candidatus Methylomirabilis sp.]|nr:hypothetical protein [Candidatus Methylomirabilis sp.]
MHLDTWLALLMSVMLVACQAPPAPGPVTKSTGVLANEALDRGDYASAADLYRTALVAEPESLPLHYGLGVAASYLDRRAEAIREFTWVLERAGADSPEATTARRWLQSVGAWRRPEMAVAPREEPAEASSSAAKEERKQRPAVLQGRALFEETPGVVAPMKRLQLLLSDYPDRVVYLRMRTDEAGRFRFSDVPPGIYKLTDAVAGPAKWRLRVELKPGQDLTLDLDLTNSTRVRDDFPDSSPSPSS